MLGRRRRRRANIEPTLGQCVVFAGWSAMVKFRLGGLDQRYFYLFKAGNCVSNCSFK